MTSVVARPPLAPLTPALRAKAADNLRKAKVQLMLAQPFFASIALKRKIDIEDNTPTAYVTNSGRIAFGTRFLAGLTVQETVFVLAHEAMHYAMMHGMRRGWRKHRPWNIAADKVINDLLKINNVGTPPKEGVFQDGAAQHAAEELYDEQDGGDEGGDGPYVPGNGNDDLSEEGGDATPEQVEQIKRELAQAVQAAKATGNVPVGVEELVDSIINPKTPWHQILERYMTNMIKDGTTWARPNRKYINLGIYLQGKDNMPRMGTVVIQADESGSIGSNEQQHFFGHIRRIAETCRPEKIIVLHTDTRVAKAEELEPEEFASYQYKAYAGGGTDMVAGIRWCEENGVEPEVFVCLTDGYTPWPEKEPGFPTFWLVTSKEQSPVGVTIPYEITD